MIIFALKLQTEKSRICAVGLWERKSDKSGKGAFSTNLGCVYAKTSEAE